MDDEAARNMARSLAKEAKADRLPPEASQRATGALGEHLSALPDALDSGVFPAEQHRALGLIVAEESLYVLEVEVADPPDPAKKGEPLVRTTTTARPYDSGDWRVSLESIAAKDLEGGAAGFRTRWTFAYANARAVEVRGEVHSRPKAEVNRSEAFARSLAKKLGFRIT